MCTTIVVAIFIQVVSGSILILIKESIERKKRK